MSARPTATSLRGATATAVLSGILVLRALGDHHLSYVEVLILCLAAMALIAAATLCVNDRIESRASAILVAVGSGVGVVLTTTIGSPGEPARSLVWLDVAILVLAVVIPALLLSTRRAKPSKTTAGAPTLTHHGASPRARGRGRRPDRRPAASDPRA